MSEQNETPIAAPDKAKGAKYIAEHPEEYGFSWGYGAIAKGAGTNKVTLREDCPHIVVPSDLTTLNMFIRTFGAPLFAKQANGTSIKVQCDRVNRDTLEKDRKTTNETLKEKIVSSVLLGVIIRTGFATTKYVVAGVVYTTAADAAKAEGNNERIKALEAAQAFLGMAVDNGIDSVVARAMAKAQWPLAFLHNVDVIGKDENSEGDLENIDENDDQDQEPQA